ncbi:GNAT family N-acetyltransferase [Halalkalibacter lacteus]|uniref:GNAT family N-acetyltransferase n=1 Tax=Halalkalibacter lacteus TaxID=3090663 RepID=UPI002FCB9ABE
MNEIVSKTISKSIKELLSYATSEDKINQEYEKYIKSQIRKLYEIKFEGETVGCVGIELISPEKCEIKHISVSPTERGNGIASKMIKYVIEKHELTFVIAETDKDAVEFYRSYGFEITSLGEKYPGVERFLCEFYI